MNESVRVVLWRHGRTGWNVESRFQGSSDIGLDAAGVAQARRAGRLLAQLNPAAVVSSDLVRAVDTARALAVPQGLPVVTDPDLRETFAGTWQGQTREQIRASDVETFRRWLAGSDVRAGGGESRSEVGERVAAAVERHAALLEPGSTLVVVTHGGATRAGLGRLLELPVPAWSSLGGLTNCAWSVLERCGPETGRRWQLLEHNARSLPEEVVGDEA